MSAAVPLIPLCAFVAWTWTASVFSSFFLHVTKACRVSEGVAPLIRNLGTQWR